MKPIYRYLSSTLLLIIMMTISFAQNPIPNAGFEDWSDGTPDDWLTLDIPGVYDAVTQSDVAHSGMSAVRGEVVSFFGSGAPPYLASDTSFFDISQNYTRLTGFYQFSNTLEDVLWVLVQFTDSQDMYVGSGEAEFGETSEGYEQFAVELDYTGGSGEPAAQAIIAFTITPSSESELDSLSVGSYFLIDDLAFENVSSLSDGGFENSPRAYQLEQNFPNPFNPSTTISFSIPQTGKVVLSIFNSIGQEVETLIDDEMTSGDHQVSFNAIDLPSGIYFYKLETGNFVDVKKMVLIR